jgi:pimeloyl-ACP methyl ester carboxylesterase
MSRSPLRALLVLTLLLATAVTAQAGPPPNPHTTTRLDFVTLDNGVTLQYAEHGHGRGQVVIFLHGYTDSWFSFSEVLDRLPARYHGYALSQRGHGDSDKPLTGYEMADFAADVAAFMDHFGIRRAAVVGHSMGSVIAQRFTLDYPERVSKLVLIGASANPGNPGLVEFLDFVQTLEDPLDPAFVYDFQASTLFGPVPPAFLATVVSESLKVPVRVWQAALAGLVAEDTRSELGSIAAPTLILWGDKDTIFPLSDQLELQAGIPGATLTIYQDVGHGLHWEQPGRAAADIAAFLR